MDSKSISKQPKHKDNPFGSTYSGFIKKVWQPKKVKTDAKLAVTDLSSGETVDAGIVLSTNKQAFIDAARFVKFYPDGIEAMKDLNKYGMAVLLFIAVNLRQDEDLVYFSINECLEHTGYSAKGMVFKGLAELCEKQFIARTEVHYKFFINPAFMFNGDRTKNGGLPYKSIPEPDKLKTDGKDLFE